MGGVGKHAVISAHTGIPNATLWDNLVNVKEGHVVYLQVAGHKLKCLVDQIKVVLPEETDDLKRVPDQDLLTLVTCTPYGINTHRILVRAHQVPMDPSDEQFFEASSGLQLQWWMWAILAAPILILLLFVLRLRKLSKQKKAAQQQEESGN